MAKAILYARVSKEEQATRYSLEGQFAELREYAESQGYEVVDEIKDPGFQRSTLDRPGINKVMERVAGGGIDAVLAWKRDRFGMAPYPSILSEQFAEYGCKMRALDDSGDGEDGEFMDDIKDAVAKLEIRKTVARARMGKLSKARQGKLMANNQADYGFRYNEARDGYEIDTETAPIVRRIFEMAAAGESLNGMAVALNREGIPTPGRSKQWNTTYINRHIIQDDVYKPHSGREIQAMVAPDVAARLDPEKSYGLYWINRYEVKTVRETKPDGGSKRRHIRHERPREDWIAVPVPDLGIPAETVEAARKTLEGNVRFPSKAAGRSWELSGGIARCSECERALTTRHVNSRGKTYFYYYCSYSFGSRASCGNRGYFAAEKLETRVADFVTDLLSDESRLVAEIDALIDKERQTLRDPEPEARGLEDRRGEIQKERDNYIRLAAKGRIEDSALDSYLSELDSEAATIKEELGKVEGRRERIRELERDKEELVKAYRQRAETGGLAEFTPDQRRDVYRRLRLVVMVGADHVAVNGDIPFAVSSLGSPLMAVFDEDESYLEESEWKETTEEDYPLDGTLFVSWKSGPRETRYVSTCSP